MKRLRMVCRLTSCFDDATLVIFTRFATEQVACRSQPANLTFANQSEMYELAGESVDGEREEAEPIRRGSTIFSS